MTESFEDRTLLVTGASSGIGRATAEGLAATGARLLLQGRTPERCAETMASVEKIAPGRVELLQADLSTLDGIRRFAADVASRTDHLDVLINNAGVTIPRRELTADGFEMTIAVNHHAYFLTTGLLLPLLGELRPSRIVNVASGAHRFGRIDLDDLDNERKYSTMRVYGQSKTANLLFNVELARRLEGTPITTNALHPGGIRSNLGGGNGPLLETFRRFVSLFLKPPEEGARTSIHLATSPEVEGVSGRYFEKCREATPSPHAVDPASASRLWSLTEERVGFDYP